MKYSTASALTLGWQKWMMEEGEGPFGGAADEGDLGAELEQLRDDLVEFGFHAVMMSGSGSTIFCMGLPRDEVIDTWKNRLQAKYEVGNANREGKVIGRRRRR